jgi:hypothetical protein
MAQKVKRYDKLEAVRLGDACVQQILESGGSLEDVVIALANEKEQLIESVTELDGIAPKRIIDRRGRNYFWHCPDDLIPESRIIRL